MGFGIRIPVELHVSRATFNSKIELENRIEYIKQSIQSNREMLFLCKFLEKDIGELHSEMNEYLEEIVNQSILLHKLELLHNYLEENPEIDIKTLNY